MILNTYAVLLAFVGVLRLLLGVLVIGLGARAWYGSGRAIAPEGRDALEDRGHLVLMLALLLLVLNLVSWPLLYLLLESYVTEWPGVMCVYGVTQVGEGSMGPSRHLPLLLRGLQLSKPALVFLGGAWFVLHALNRRTPGAALLPRLFLLLVPLGLLAAADATAELAYLGIPKKEEFPTSGCCTAEEDTRFLPDGGGQLPAPWLFAAFYGVNLALVVVLSLSTWRPGRPPGSLGLGLLVLGGVAGLAVSGRFLVEIAAPALLGLPYHRCAYDLIPRVPEAVIAVTMYVGGCFFLGWAGVARWLGHGPQTEAMLPKVVWVLLRLSLSAYLASLVMLSLELVLA